MASFYEAPLVSRVVAREDHSLALVFDNGEARVFDVKPLLDLPVFKPLRRLDAFRQVRVVYGSLEWPAGCDLAHDMLYHRSVPLPVEAA